MNTYTLKLMQPSSKNLSLRFSVLAFVLFLAIMSSIIAAPLPVLVSDVGTNNGIGEANTSRNIAVASNGDIFVVFSGSNGIRVAKSTNNGQTFLPSVPVAPGNYEAEIEIESGGLIYLSWLVGGQVMFSRSTDGGSTFSTPAVIGPNSSGFGVHLASFGPNVYVLERDGNVLLINNSFGVGPFTQKIIDFTRVFSDVRVDQNTGVVYVMTDDPYLRLYSSINNGLSFVQTNVTPSSYANYSSYSLSFGPLGTFMFVFGYISSQAYKVDVTNGNSSILTGGVNTNAQGRTLASDKFGNFVDGFYNYGTLKFRISYDQGTTWQPDVTVANGYSHNVAINPNNYDVLAVYSQGGQVYLNVFNNQLKVPLTVLTSSFTNVTCSSADVSGEVINNGAGTVGTRGVVYSTTTNPTIANSYIVSGTGTGTFTSNLTNLCPGTTYYVRAFAKDAWGNIWYGNELSFTTLTPSFTVSLSPSLLWPPNHKLKTINTTINCDMDCNWTAVLSSITSNEPDNGLGDGDTPNDIQNANIGSSDFTFDLRAERSGTGSGRIYTATYTITDACGGTYTASANVNVPKSYLKQALLNDNSLSSINVYPNPSNDFINLNLNFAYSANAKISISDVLGNTINSFEISDVNSIQKEVNIQSLVPGIYLINITFGEEHFVERFIKI